jgi:riboflavin kinase/FMN adenylyltransferase
MKLIKLADTKGSLNLLPAAVTWGVFDGVHRGHQFLIRSLVEMAWENKLKSTVLIVEPNPKKVIVDPNLKEILSLDGRTEEIKALGVDQIFQLVFNSNLKNMLPFQFLENLNQQLNCKFILAGYDLRFGLKQQGGLDELKEFGKDHNCKIQVSDALFDEEQSVCISSRQIRALIQKGHLSKTEELLGRPYVLKCSTKKGDGRGKKWGFPTLNLVLTSNMCLPPDGVYLCQVEVEKKRLKGVLNLGFRPTIEGQNAHSLEVHILNQTLLNFPKEVKVIWGEFLRSEKKFSSHEELFKQIKEDANLARQKHGLLEKI